MEVTGGKFSEEQGGFCLGKENFVWIKYLQPNGSRGIFRPDKTFYSDKFFSFMERDWGVIFQRQVHVWRENSVRALL